MPVKRTSRTADRLHLEHFVPYRLSVLTNIVSMSIAEAYEREFGLTIPQWRVIAVLARYPDLSAIEVAERTAMDKVAVSRAVQGLLADRRLVRAYDSGRPAPHASASVERRSICIHTGCAPGARLREEAARRAQPHGPPGAGPPGRTPDRMRRRERRWRLSRLRYNPRPL